MGAGASILFEDEIKLLEQISSFIDDNISENLSAERLAAEFRLGLWTLRRHFLLYYRQPIHSYVHERRMLKAMELLLDHKSSIKQISKIIGYKRCTSFTHAFTKHFGHPPIFYLRNSVEQ